MESHHAVFGYHRGLLCDSTRVERFERALRERVVPGSVVLDIGCGTGVLSILACRAGARRVYAIEQGEVGHLAKEVIAKNGLSDRIVVLCGISSRLTLPEPVDLVVGEVLGNLGLNEGILQSFVDARTRFLRPGGSLIPTSLRVVAVPVEAAERYERLVAFWADGVAGCDYSVLGELAAQQTYHEDIAAGEFIADPANAIEIHLNEATSLFAKGAAEYSLHRSGLVHGIAVWFDASLTDSVAISNAPPNEVPSWHQTFLPLKQPMLAEAGDRFKLVLSTHNGTSWRWEVEHSSADGSRHGRSEQSTFSGFPVAIEDLRSNSLQFVPERGPLTAALEFALRQIDGRRTMEELTTQLQEMFVELFPTTLAARDYLTRVLRICSGRAEHGP